MKFLVALLFCASSYAHEGHHADLKAAEGLSGKSVWQLDSTWKNQNGEDVKLSSLQGKARLVAMLYTRCATACPLIVEDIKKVSGDLQEKAKEVEITIFSLDSDQETPETLSAFSKKRKLSPNWQLLTSKAGAVAELAAVLGVRYKKLKDGEYIHSNVIYYLNKEGEIMARKEGLKTPSEEFVQKVKRDISLKK